jgi:cytochrome c556
MRTLGLLFLALAVAAMAQAPTFQSVGTMSQLMVDIIYPTSDALFYVQRTPPQNERDWESLQSQALMLAESANLLMLPSRARDQDKWIKESRELLDIGAAAYKAAKAHNIDAIVALSDRLNDACVSCHQDYRTNYRRRPLSTEKQ